jgi:endonuclease/exonuclease/phosphatase family metal-dependent hydrolase
VSLLWLVVCCQPGLTAGAANEDPPQTLVFCAYNVKNWLQMDRFDGGVVSKNSSKPEAEKAAVIATLKTISPDILGLSEIGTAQDLAEIQSLLKQAGLDLPHSELAQGGDPTRRLGLLSRFPFSSRQSLTDLTYKLGGQVIPVQRGFLDVSIQPYPEIQLRFIGVHFKSMREIPEADQSLMRRHESSLLRKHVDAILEDAPDAALLLYGDFNEHRHEPPIKTIHGSRTSLGYLEDIRVRDPQGQTWTHFWETADSYSRLDYFFASRAMKRLIDPNGSYIFDSPTFLEASDHRPIITTLQLPASKTTTQSKTQSKSAQD